MVRRLRIADTGNIGIGVTNPLALLQVGETHRANSTLAYFSGAGTADSLKLAVKAGNVDVTNNKAYRLTLDYNEGTDENGYIDFYRGSSSGDGDLVLGTGGSDRMRITDTGFVGINETDPQSTLDVTGDFRVTSGATRYVVDPTVAVSGYEAVVSMTDSGLEHTLNTTSRGFVWSNGRGEHMRIDAAGDAMMQGSLEVNGSSFVHDTPDGRITFDRDVGINRIMSTTTGFASYQTLETRAADFTWRLGTAAPAMTLSDAGNLLIGKAAAGYTSQGIELNGELDQFIIKSASNPMTINRDIAGPNATVTAFYLENTLSGVIAATKGGAPVFAASSDERLKDNIVDHESELANVMSLRPTRWGWKDEAKGSGEGFIAQELEATAWSDLVSEDDDGFKMVAGLGAVETRLIKAMQEQQALIEALTAKVEALENA
jgi:hypothetical protein